MEDDYGSPDSDGHASIPSPTETSFNISNGKLVSLPATGGVGGKLMLEKLSKTQECGRQHPQLASLPATKMRSRPL